MYKELINLGEILSEGICLLRVDFYLLGKTIYLGELTFYHNGGFTPFTPVEWDKKLGDKIDIKK